MFSSFMAFLGYATLAAFVRERPVVGYFALFLVIGGIFSLFPLVMSVAEHRCRLIYIDYLRLT